jgi:hypothetical protein
MKNDVFVYAPWKPGAILGVQKPAHICYGKGMMIIQQTIEIPADHSVSHLRLDVPLPEKHPSGTVTVEIALKPNKNGFFSKFFTSKFYKNFDEFYGCLKNSDVFEGDSVEIVRQMRDDQYCYPNRNACLSAHDIGDGKADKYFP